MKHTANAIERGDIFFAEFDKSTGSELLGTHPVVIVQNNKGNFYSPTVIGAAVSSQVKKDYLPTHIILKSGPCAGSMVMTEQLYTLDKRLQRVCDKAHVKCIQLVDPPKDSE